MEDSVPTFIIFAILVAPVPPDEMVASMCFYFVRDGLLYKAVVPHKLASLVLSVPCGHLGFKPTVDKTRSLDWRPTLSRDVHS